MGAEAPGSSSPAFRSAARLGGRLGETLPACSSGPVWSPPTSLELRYVESAALPTLAWCARIDRASERIAVLHGRGVEVRPRGFDAASLYVSNSPAFVMAAAGDEPDEIYPFYPYDPLRIFRRGVACQAGRVRPGSARRLGVHYATIMSVEGTAASFAPHMLCDSPPDHASYEALLVEGTKKIWRTPASRAAGCAIVRSPPCRGGTIRPRRRWWRGRQAAPRRLPSAIRGSRTRGPTAARTTRERSA